MKRSLALLCAALLCAPAFSDAAPRHGGAAPSGGGGSAPTIDAASFASGLIAHTATSGTCTITTPGTNRTIIVGVAATNTSSSTSMNVSGVADTSSLTWHSTTALVDTSTGTKNLELWWAFAASVVTGDTVTVTIANAVDAGVIGCVSVAGANSSAPMDPGGGTALPRGSTGTPSGTPTVTNVSTAATNSLIIGMATENSGGVGCGSASAGAGFTVIGSMVANNGGSWFSCLMMESMGVSSAQSGLTVATGITWPQWAMRVDALKP